MNCPNCGKELVNIEGRRAKKFCNSTCRSNVWQKANRKAAKKVKKTASASESQNVNIEERIAKIEDMLKMPPKYLPPWKRTPLEDELSRLKFELLSKDK